jgi:hypothetical protein
MTINEIKEKIKDWVSEMAPMNLTIGDLMLFAFDKSVSGKEIEKGVSALANDGFLVYVESTVKNPMNGEPLPCFRKTN